MNILGINSAYHESSACLMRDGRVVAAAEEERFTRVRHAKSADLKNPHQLPIHSIRFCLEAAGLSMEEIDHIGFSFLPGVRGIHNVGLAEPVEPGRAGSLGAEEEFDRLLRLVPKVLSEEFGCDVIDRFHWLGHHECHAASAFFASPFGEAAVLSIDGIGESGSIWLGVGRDRSLSALRVIDYPNSLGMLWTKASRYLGFGDYGQWKVMGLAGYGDPTRFYDTFRSFVTFDEEGGFSVDPNVLQIRATRYDGFEALFGSRRERADAFDKRHMDFAAALQKLTDDVVLALATFLARETELDSICLAGGVALNCVTNGLLIDHGPFEHTFIQPAANDAGTAYGACHLLWNRFAGQAARGAPLDHVYLGPSYSRAHVCKALMGSEFEVRSTGDAVPGAVADLLARGNIVAWFQGAMEFGPRALGNRSILADPRRPDIGHALNDRVKRREFFRPFAASVLDEAAEDWFEISRRSPSDEFMLVARKVLKSRVGLIPAVTHVDGSCRIHRVRSDVNPTFHRLIAEFGEITGVPMLLNTSFNDSEPIICSPVDALTTCRRAGIRYAVFGGDLIDLEPATVRVAAPLSGDVKSIVASLSAAMDVQAFEVFAHR